MNDPSLDPAGFPTGSREAWRAAVEKVLRGRTFDDVLVSESLSGIEIQPLYAADDVSVEASGVPLDDNRVLSGWDVRQQHSGVDPATCNLHVLEDLEKGVTSVEIVAPVEGWSSEALHTALEGVLLDIAPVALAPHNDLAAARAFAGLIAERGDSETTGSWLGLDPIGEIARSGAEPSLAAAARLGADLAPRLPGAAVFTVDATRYSDAGATSTQEMAWALATGVAYLRALEEAGLTLAQAASTIGFRSTAGADQFTTIAAMRASRRLWDRVLDACGVPVHHRHHQIQAVTARSMFSRRDPWVNMLRSTTAALGAGLGGADSVTVLPFDNAIEQANSFARRNARNTQLLLIEESQLGRLVDPASGSWFVESLTNRIAQQAWAIFQEVEARGGIEVGLADGSVRSEIDHSWATRLGHLADRTEPITGVTEFPEVDNDPPTGLAASNPTDPSGDGLPLRRLAAPFENLRDAADRAASGATGRPSVCLVTLGDLAVHTARSTWTSNLLAVGGVRTVGYDGDGAYSPLQAEVAFTDTGCGVAVICSSDAVYAERAAATATALKEAGAVLVVVAGDPGEQAEALRSAGVDEFWHAGMDVLDTLRRLHSTLGIG